MSKVEKELLKCTAAPFPAAPLVNRNHTVLYDHRIKVLKADLRGFVPVAAYPQERDLRGRDT